MINYELTKQSEENIKNNFNDFFIHVVSEWTYFYNALKATGKITFERIQKIYKLEDRANQYSVDILDECIWHISKYQPMGSHLRFIISIISSTSDLERMADHVIGAAKIIYNHPTMDKKAISLLVKAINVSITYVKRLQVYLNKEKEYKANVKTFYEKVANVENEYQLQYKAITVELSKILYDHSTPAQIVETMNGVAMILKYTERNVDHIVNIIENFIYIHESDFFIQKQSKRSKAIKSKTKKMKTSTTAQKKKTLMVKQNVKN